MRVKSSLFHLLVARMEACLHGSLTYALRLTYSASLAEPRRRHPEGRELDDTQFDTWTRRRFGLAVGGAAATALGILGGLGLSEEDAEARRRNKPNRNRKNDRRKNRRRDRCRKLGQSCNENRRRQQCCSSTQLCAQVPNLGSGDFCCRQLSQNCSRDDDCCGRNRCRSGVCQTP